MNHNRLEQLIEFYTDDPNDPFIIYGLALEYQKTDIDKSEQLFDKLLTEFPDYLPTYYQAAMLKAALKKIEIAKALYIEGIDLALRLNDRNTLRELQAAYNELSWDES